MTVEAVAMPAGALLARYEAQAGAYTDSFAARIEREVSLAEFVEAFYTTWLFKSERLVLTVIGHGSDDAGAAAVARAETNRFAAWTVEDRTETELLMCDLSGRTRSWLGVTPKQGATTLHFGSAVVPMANGRMGAGFCLLLGFHTLYSRMLLRAAVRRLKRT